MKLGEPKDIFLEALERESPAERAAFVEEACRGDEPLQREVESLLRAHSDAGSFLDGLGRPWAGMGGAGMDEEEPGGMIGRYRLREKIGEGGFGVVYLAEQREPLKRRVALKVIKLGMDTRQVVARFEAERQALALMDHPNIARVLDGGATSAGRPYFVMELVRGVPVTEYCEEHRCTMEERLRLFIRICDAIQHAHQKGIIHRDIKPTNVLVTSSQGEAVPKVIDFGVAKATQQELTDKTVFTRVSELIGTPAYMSPEQAQLSAVDVDTRTDIYALGVLLYELLTGAPPFDSRELLLAGCDEMRRRIREEEPVRPSARLQALTATERSAMAARRGTTPERLQREIEGELDWIILKCMEKERARRYESAAALAQDLERFLKNEPVTAAAPSVWYKARKFAVRHKTMVMVSVLLAGSLAGAAFVSTYFVFRARRAELQARDKAAIAEAVSAFLNEDFFGQADPTQEPDPELRVRTSLDRAAAQIGQRFRGQPLVEAAVQTAVGKLYQKLSEYEAAERHLTRALELRFHEMGELHLDTAEVMDQLAYVRLFLRRNEDARDLSERALGTVSHLLGETATTTLHFQSRLAWVYYTTGLGEKSRELAEQVLQTGREMGTLAPGDEAQALQLLGRALGREKKRDEGEALLRESLQILVRHEGEGHPRVIGARNNLAAYFLDHNYNLAEAEELLLRAFEQHRRIFGEAHFMTIQMRGNLVILYRRLGRPREAAENQLAILEFRGAKARLADIQALPPLLLEAGLESLLGNNTGGSWRVRHQPPLSTWATPEHDESRWREVEAPSGGEFWARNVFYLERLPERAPVLLMHGNGSFRAYLNGQPVSPRLFRKSEGFQVAVLDEEHARALVPGRNVLAVHGEGTGDTAVRIDLIIRPGLAMPGITREEPK